MALAGCKGLNLGVETGDADLMAQVGKPGGVDPDKVAEVRHIAGRYGIKVHFLMMVGLPDETKETVFHSYQLLDHLRPESISVTAVSPFPGTQLYEDAIANDWIIGDVEAHIADGSTVTMRGRNLSAEQVLVARNLLILLHRESLRSGFRSAAKAALLRAYFALWRRFDLSENSYRWVERIAWRLA